MSGRSGLCNRFGLDCPCRRCYDFGDDPTDVRFRFVGTGFPASYVAACAEIIPSKHYDFSFFNDEHILEYDSMVQGEECETLVYRKESVELITLPGNDVSSRHTMRLVLGVVPGIPLVLPWCSLKSCVLALREQTAGPSDTLQSDNWLHPSDWYFFNDGAHDRWKTCGHRFRYPTSSFVSGKVVCFEEVGPEFVVGTARIPDIPPSISVEVYNES